MKKTVILICAAVILTSVLSGCFVFSHHILPYNRDAISFYRQNEELFLQAAETGDFSEVKKLAGVKDVVYWEDIIDISCGGEGFGPETLYSGFFYSEKDDMLAHNFACDVDKLEPEGEGYHWKDRGGDNEYYVEPLGNHYFYYEAHF